MNRRKFLGLAAAAPLATRVQPGRCRLQGVTWNPQSTEPFGRMRFRLTQQPELTLGMLQQAETRLKVEAMLAHQKFRQEKFFSIVASTLQVEAPATRPEPNTEYYDATEKTV